MLIVDAFEQSHRRHDQHVYYISSKPNGSLGSVMYSFIYLLYSTYLSFALGNLTLEFPSYSPNNIIGTRPRQECLTWEWQLARWLDFL
jgi:hypothetical protein